MGYFRRQNVKHEKCDKSLCRVNFLFVCVSLSVQFSIQYQVIFLLYSSERVCLLNSCKSCLKSDQKHYKVVLTVVAMDCINDGEEAAYKKKERRKGMRKAKRLWNKQEKLNQSMKKIETMMNEKRKKEMLKEKVRQQQKIINSLRHKQRDVGILSNSSSAIVRQPTRLLRFPATGVHGATESLIAVDRQIRREPPIILQEDLSHRMNTAYKGTFGSIIIMAWRDIDVAVKVLNSSTSSPLGVRCEAKILLTVSHHPLFPKFYGIVDTHQLVMEDLGWMDELGNYQVSTIQNTMGKSVLSRVQWVGVCREVVEGVMFLHDISLLHNDIKANNVILQYPSNKVKIIDFGKATLTRQPRTYHLSEKERLSYDSKFRYLAHELRNVKNTALSEMTDTYSVGYLFKYIGILEKFLFVKDLGRQMKDTSVQKRLPLSTALAMLNNYRE